MVGCRRGDRCTDFFRCSLHQWTAFDLLCYSDYRCSSSRDYEDIQAVFKVRSAWLGESTEQKKSSEAFDLSIKKNIYQTIIMEIKLEDRLPLLDVEHDSILSMSGDISRVLKVEWPDMGTSSESELEALHYALLRAVKILGEGWIIHQQTRIRPLSYAAPSVSASFLSEASSKFFNGRKYYHLCGVIVLTKKASSRQTDYSASNLLRNQFVPEQTINENKFIEIKAKVSQFAQILKDCSLQVEIIPESEILSTQSRAGLLEQYLFLNDRNEPLVKDISFSEYVRIGNKFLNIYSLSDIDSIPTLCGPVITDTKYSGERTRLVNAFSTPLHLGLKCDHITNIVFETLDSRAAMQQCVRKLKRFNSLSAYSKENTIARDSVNAYMNECIAEQRMPVKLGVNIMLIADSLSELQEERKSVMAACSQIDCVAKLESVAAAQIWWACLPGNASQYPAGDMITTFSEQACCFLNTEKNWRDAND
jgi:hypothetical protein